LALELIQELAREPGGHSEHEWFSSENGHATAIIHDDKLYLFFQGRSQSKPEASDNNWCYGVATYALESLGGVEASHVSQVDNLAVA